MTKWENFLRIAKKNMFIYEVAVDANQQSPFIFLARTSWD